MKDDHAKVVALFGTGVAMLGCSGLVSATAWAFLDRAGAIANSGTLVTLVMAATAIGLAGCLILFGLAAKEGSASHV